MARYRFRLGTVGPYDRVRVTTDAPGSTLAAGMIAEGYGIPVDPILVADHAGRLPTVLGPDAVTTLYVQASVGGGSRTGAAPDTPAAPASAITLLELGTKTEGASVETLVAGTQYMKKVTVPAGGALLQCIGARVKNPGGSVGELTVGLLADAAGVPGILLAGLPHPGQNSFLIGSGDISKRWLMMPLTTWLPAADYWLALFHVGAAGGIGLDIYYAAGGSDPSQAPGSGNTWLSDGGAYSIGNTGKNYSIKAQLLTGVTAPI